MIDKKDNMQRRCVSPAVSGALTAASCIAISGELTLIIISKQYKSSPVDENYFRPAFVQIFLAEKNIAAGQFFSRVVRK